MKLIKVFHMSIFVFFVTCAYSKAQSHCAQATLSSHQISNLKKEICEQELKQHLDRTEIARQRVEAKNRWDSYIRRTNPAVVQCLENLLALEGLDINSLIRDGIYPKREYTVDLLATATTECN